MCCHLRKAVLWRNKYRRAWSEAARIARRLVRAYDICRSRASTANIFVCAVL